MENRRGTVLEAFSVPDGLCHCLGYVQPFHPLALDMDPGETGQVRDLSKALSAARLHVVAVRLEDVGQLDLSGPALAL